jgi:drug/metabolite transporter (DMT)-like permease
MSRPLAALTLLLCTLLWGVAFLFQKGAMAHMGPLVFTAIRYTIGTLLVLPLALAEYRRRVAVVGPFTRRQWGHIAVLLLSFFAGVVAQQVALQTTTVTNGGFLTALYVIFTPVAGFVFTRVRPHPVIYIGAPMALIGIYMLTGADFRTFSFGDGLLVFGAVCWALQIAMLAPLSQETGMPITLSAACFGATAILAAIGTPIFEQPTWDSVSSGWVEILYTGVMSTTIAFTLQAIGQQYLPAANAAIILSAESLVAALAGAIVLGERLPLVGYAGAALIFAAILLVELVPVLQAGRRAPVATTAGPAGG